MNRKRTISAILGLLAMSDARKQVFHGLRVPPAPKPPGYYFDLSKAERKGKTHEELIKLRMARVKQ